MKLEDAIEAVVSKRSMLKLTGLHDGDEDLEALHVVVEAVIKARRAAEEIFCTCNCARRFEDVARDVFDALEVPSSSPHAASTCPFHRG